MPVMLRPLGKAKKIAFKILGKPENLKDKRTYRDLRINRRLNFEYTYRVR